MEEEEVPREGMLHIAAAVDMAAGMAAAVDIAVAGMAVADIYVAGGVAAAGIEAHSGREWVGHVRNFEEDGLDTLDLEDNLDTCGFEDVVDTFDSEEDRHSLAVVEDVIDAPGCNYCLLSNSLCHLYYYLYHHLYHRPLFQFLCLS